MGFVMLAMMIVWVIMTPRIAFVVRMLMTALLASMGESLRPNPHQGLVSLHQAAIALAEASVTCTIVMMMMTTNNVTTLTVPRRRTAVTMPVNASIKMIVVIITLMATAIIRSLRYSPREAINRITSTSISTHLHCHRDHHSRSI